MIVPVPVPKLLLCMYTLLCTLIPGGVVPTERVWSVDLGTFIPTEAIYWASGLEEVDKEEEVEV